MYKNTKINDKPTNLRYCKETFRPAKTNILYDKLKDGEKNLYIVGTPLQLLSAIEAQHHFKTKNNVLVILLFVIGNGSNINQMFEISKNFPYSKLITFQNNKGININAKSKYLKELSKHSYNYAFFGHVTPAYRRMIANIKYNYLYLVDDGIYSITINKQLLNKKNSVSSDFIITQEPKNIRKKLRNIVYFSKGIKVDSNLDDLNFFTMFNLEKYNNIIINNYSYVKKLFSNGDQLDNNIYILGQPLKNVIGMSTVEYIKYLENVFTYYKQKNIIYIPHRSEVLSDLFEYVLHKQNNVSILHPNMPIELYFMKKGVFPSIVIAFASSALFTIQKIFPESKLAYIEIDTSPYTAFHQENIQLIYDNYKKEGIEKFELSNI